MEMELDGHNQNPTKATFKDVVSGTNHWFPNMQYILKQLQEHMEEEIIEPDTTLK